MSKFFNAPLRYIVHLTAELAPLAKAGGLGDVVSSLAKAFTARGNRVEVILPFYNHIDKKALHSLQVDLTLGSCKATAWSAEYEGISLVLIEPDKERNYLAKKAIYGGEDELLRFTHFTKNALSYLQLKGKKIDILHLHDWLTALAAPLYYDYYRAKGLKIGKVVTTIHNMHHQGVCTRQLVRQLSARAKKKMQDPNCSKRLNLVKGALIYSDQVTTVSPTYAKEIEGREGGALRYVVRAKKKKLSGILNGIDTHYWNPETDPFLAKNYGGAPLDIEEVLAGKEANKRGAAKLLKMDVTPAPLFACISRLTRQKGPELICSAIEHALEHGGSFILLGSSPDPDLRGLFRRLEKRFANHPRLHLHFCFDEALAHLVYAAADFIVVPSLFEPCGLVQMIAMRYGALPIVHHVGGLKDSVHCGNNPNGYAFEKPCSDQLRESIDRALEDKRRAPRAIEQMIKNGMHTDWSWKKRADEYAKVYGSI